MTLADIECLVKQSTGLDPASLGVAAVDRAVRQRLRACRLDNLDAYGKLLRDSPAELQALIEVVVVAETWFFRDVEAFTALERFVHDEWLRSNPSGMLRMLSLPCATGEEPFSMAIKALDAGLPADRFSVDAVDISDRLLNHARRGAYSRSAFRGNRSDMRSRHFVETSGSWRVTDAVRRQVHFRHDSLFSPLVSSGAEAYDVVFCRNLLIYFDRPTQNHAIDVLSNLLAPNGILFVGPSETMAFLDRGFVPEGTPKAFAFRNGGAWRRTERVVPAASMPCASCTPAAPRPRAGREDDTHRAATRETSQGRALEESTRFANQGRFEDAARCCQDSVHRDGPSASALYLLGLMRDAEGCALEAMSCYKKALYLDPHHEDALTHLALLLDRLDKKPEAERLRTRARRAALRSGT